MKPGELMMTRYVNLYISPPIPITFNMNKETLITVAYL